MYDGHIMLAARDAGRGRSVFFAGLPYSLENSRLLYRAILWVAHKENETKKWFCTNPNTDCAYYPKRSMLAVVNNVNSPQTTMLYRNGGKPVKMSLKPYETIWKHSRGFSPG